MTDIKKTAKEQERVGVGISATCTKFISLVDESLRDAYLKGIQQTLEACRILNIRSVISQTGNVLEGNLAIRKTNDGRNAEALCPIV